MLNLSMNVNKYVSNRKNLNDNAQQTPHMTKVEEWNNMNMEIRAFERVTISETLSSNL